MIDMDCHQSPCEDHRKGHGEGRRPSLCERHCEGHHEGHLDSTAGLGLYSVCSP